MLSHSQVVKFFELIKDRTSFFSLLPADTANLVSRLDYESDPNSKIGIALRYAAQGEAADLNALIEMIKTNPRLLLQAGDVVTRGGVLVKRVKLYEFFLGEGDPFGAKQIEFGFKKIGEEERDRQYEHYKPHIEALERQLKTKQPAFDLRPLIKAIIDSAEDEITDALNINDPNRSVARNTLLSKKFSEFRSAVRPQTKTEGMHYEHYTTLLQAFDLLRKEWEALSNNYSNFNKCNLVWRQVIGYLQRSLPAVDRFAFARGFKDSERTVNYQYRLGSFPNSPFGSEALPVLGFMVAICGGYLAGPDFLWGAIKLPEVTAFENHLLRKCSGLAELMPQQSPACDRVRNNVLK